MSAAPVPFRQPPAAPVSPAQRIQRMQTEARIAAHAHVGALIDALNQVASLSADAASFGELVPVGVREIAARLAETDSKHALTIIALMDRAS